jgi:hypothetical protein
MGITRIGTTVSALFLGAITQAYQTKRIRQTDNGNWMLAQP